MQNERLVEPPRVRKFRHALVKAIPRFPNDKTSLQHMRAKQLPALVIDYLSWRSRYVAVRPRRVEVELAAKADPRWSSISGLIATFLEKVKQGDDLTPYLSMLPHTRGYSVAASAPRVSNEDRWSDKDFLLNTMGYHHFHLDAADEKKGHRDGPDDLIFAEVTRDAFKVIAIFGHEVFDPNSPERMRLWAIHREIAFRPVPPGSVVIMGNITTSGHDSRVVFYAQHCLRIIKQVEPKLDDSEYVRRLYNQVSEAPLKPKPEWTFLNLDLAVFDGAKPAYIVIQKGWN